MSAPWDFAQARQACADASRAQRDAEDALKQAAHGAALAEEAYRKTLASAIVEAHAEGVAWSVAADVARGRPDVAKLRRERDIAEGVREALSQAAWRRAADRRDTGRLCEWAMRRDLAEGYGQVPEPGRLPEPIGARRVA